ncbi:HNH endonuclease signature motif containing protein [Bacillus cereus]|uniref:HNH nuclease domain-containing protein n=1 Tax=Bacillus cereus TaxID=1396 RepID=A0A2C1DHH9_BACCE|nr:HNH endonuclease signature motif containing protein [Bacillus cereus]PGS99418.1 hypothetical protein COD09_17940 [Bacillus cereus]
MSKRPSIPSNVALQLRQEAGFGCCKCGCPIIEYHHIVPWEECQHFDPQHMMVLCPTCHTAIGKRERNVQYTIKNNPYSQQQGKVGWKIPLLNSTIQIQMGGKLFIGAGQVLRIDDNRLLELHVDSQGLLEISIDLKDENGVLLATINENQWESDLTNVFDVQHTESKLEIKAEQHKISLKITMIDSVIGISGHFWSNGQHVNIQSSRVSINGASKIIGLDKELLLSNTCLCILSDTGEYFLAGQNYFDDDQVAPLIPIIYKAIEGKNRVTIYTKNGLRKSVMITELDGFTLYTDGGDFELQDISEIV